VDVPGNSKKPSADSKGRVNLRAASKTLVRVDYPALWKKHAGNYTGKEARPIPPTYDPKVTVDKLVQLVAEPEDEVITGWQGKLFNFFHKLMPNVIEKMMASNTEKTQFKEPPPAPKSPGAVHQPSGR